MQDESRNFPGAYKIFRGQAAENPWLSSYGQVGPIWPKQCATHSAEAEGLTSIPPIICGLSCMSCAKCSRCFVRNVPGRLLRKMKSFALKNVFWGPRLAVVTSPPYTKTY